MTSPIQALKTPAINTTQEKKTNENPILSTLKIIPIDPKKPETESAFNKCKPVFLNSFEKAYENFTLEDLKLSPTEFQNKKEFLEAAFNDEKQAFNYAKTNESTVFFYKAEAVTSNDTDDNEPLTIAYASMNLTPQKGEIYLRQMAVKQNCQKLGIANRLALKMLRDAGNHYTNLLVNVRIVNQAVKSIGEKIGADKVETMEGYNPESYVGYKINIQKLFTKLITPSNQTLAQYCTSAEHRESFISNTHSQMESFEKTPETYENPTLLLTKLFMTGQIEAAKTVMKLRSDAMERPLKHETDFEGLKYTRLDDKIKIDFSNGDYPIAYAVYFTLLSQLDGEQNIDFGNIDLEKLAISQSPREVVETANNTGNLPIHLIAGKRPEALPELLKHCETLDIDRVKMVNAGTHNPDATPLRNAISGLSQPGQRSDSYLEAANLLIKTGAKITDPIKTQLDALNPRYLLEDNKIVEVS